MGSNVPTSDSRPIFFFDIDNCLYPRSKRVHDLMQKLIDQYFIKHLELPADDAKLLHQQYYTDYGLAISGLVKHHKIDPLAYNREVDDALPLDDVITPDPQLRRLLEDIDRTKVKLWLFTNAYITHARRVVRLLGVDDMFEGITFCDYGKVPFLCKPHTEMWEKAEEEAAARSSAGCFFVDDSALNCREARKRGWTVVHKLEQEDPEPEVRAGTYQIRSLEELRGLLSQFFKNGEGHEEEVDVSSQL